MSENYKQKYHEIWIPLLDIYKDGEEEAFLKLSRKEDNEKNLIIFPSQYRQELSPQKKRNIVERVPGTGALDFLIDKHLEEKVLDSNENYTVFEIDEGLDLAYMKEPNFLETKDLIDRVAELFGDPEHPSSVMTTNQGDYMYFLSEQVPVQKPRDFILADSSIVKKGMLPSTEQFSNKVYSIKRKHDEKVSIPLDEAQDLMDQEIFMNQIIQIRGKPTEYFIVTGDFKRNEDKTEIIDVKNPRVELIKFPNNLAYNIGEHFTKDLAGISAQGIDQYLAVQYGILNPNVEIAFICGGIGSGKTILSYSAGLELILKYPKEIQEKMHVPRNDKGEFRDSFFDQIAIFRPNDPVGGSKRDEGTLPGDLWEKTEQQFGGFITAHDYSPKIKFPFKQLLMHPRHDFNDSNEEKLKKSLKIGEGYLPTKNPPIGLYSFGDIRGRSFEKTLVIVDEAQNFTHKELKAIISRLSHYSKIIILGDLDQVDNPECSLDKNGLTSAIRHYLPFENSFLAYLTENRRSATSRRSISMKS